MKKIISAVVLALTITSALPAQASYEASVPHLVSSRSDSAGRFGLARYSITLHVTGYELAEFSITPPKGTTLSSSVNVFDASGKALDTRVEMKGETVKLVFSKPIVLNTMLTIELADVKTPDNTVIRDLITSAKVGKMSQSIPLMSVRILPSIHS